MYVYVACNSQWGFRLKLITCNIHVRKLFSIWQMAIFFQMKFRQSSDNFPDILTHFLCTLLWREKSVCAKHWKDLWQMQFLIYSSLEFYPINKFAQRNAQILSWIFLRISFLVTQWDSDIFFLYSSEVVIISVEVRENLFVSMRRTLPHPVYIPLRNFVRIGPIKYFNFSSSILIYTHCRHFPSWTDSSIWLWNSIKCKAFPSQ